MALIVISQLVKSIKKLDILPWIHGITSHKKDELTLPQKEQNTPDIVTLVTDIKYYLNVVNAALIQPEDFSLDNYEELTELYDYVKKKDGKLTLMEIEGVLDELRGLRQANNSK
jgi:uncharacterized protein YfkK (UPF0435 family)